MQTNRRYQAQVRCVHCARGLGSWEWTDRAPSGVGTLITVEGSRQSGVVWRMRCRTCSGPVLLEDVETVRERKVVEWGPEKRGRKPKERTAA